MCSKLPAETAARLIEMHCEVVAILKHIQEEEASFRRLGDAEHERFYRDMRILLEQICNLFYQIEISSFQAVNLENKYAS